MESFFIEIRVCLYKLALTNCHYHILFESKKQPLLLKRFLIKSYFVNSFICQAIALATRY